MGLLRRVRRRGVPNCGGGCWGAVKWDRCGENGGIDDVLLDQTDMFSMEREEPLGISLNGNCTKHMHRVRKYIA